MKELRGRIAKLKPGKACGLDLITTELLKALAAAPKGDILEKLLEIFHSVVDSGSLPPGGLEGLVKPLHKSGDRAGWANYRLITLLSIVWKLLNPSPGTASAS